MATYATLDDVQDRYETEIPASMETVLQTKLNDAEAILINAGGPLADAITAGRTTADNVKIVLCDMVLRWLRNPTGVKQETAGPFSYSRDSGVASGVLFLTKRDRQMLGLQRGAVSLRLNDDALEHPTRGPARRWWIGNRYPPGYSPDWDC